MHEKWGFGLAPVKPLEQVARVDSVSLVLEVLDAPAAARGRREDVAEAMSHAKGLFSRAYRQDQWDWATTWLQLGRPSARRAQLAASTLKSARDAALGGDDAAVLEAATLLAECGGVQALRGFATRDRHEAPLPGHGYVYVLSTREQPRMLKVGYTARDVIKRVDEINRATGVVIPFGLRAVWVVRDAPTAEARVHELLDAYRVRRDREFFDMDFRDARRLIDGFVRLYRLEV